VGDLIKGFFKVCWNISQKAVDSYSEIWVKYVTAQKTIRPWGWPSELGSQQKPYHTVIYRIFRVFTSPVTGWVAAHESITHYELPNGHVNTINTICMYLKIARQNK